MRIARMQVNHIDNPLGFDLGERPTFSWVVEDAVGTRAEASRVVVSRAGEVVADTGWAELSSLACGGRAACAAHTIRVARFRANGRGQGVYERGVLVRDGQDA